MVACSAAARDLGDCFRRLPSPQAAGLLLDEDRLDDLIGGLEYLLRTFRDEIDARPLFAMSQASAELYDQSTPLFGERVEDAFPSAAQDVSEAGRCMAAGRWTAAVMHLMRALETPLALLAADVGVGVGANWNKSLNDMEAHLRAISKRSHGSDAEQWAAEAGRSSDRSRTHGGTTLCTEGPSTTRNAQARYTEWSERCFAICRAGCQKRHRISADIARPFGTTEVLARADT